MTGPTPTRTGASRSMRRGWPTARRPPQLAERADLLAALRRALAGLDPADRDTLVRRFGLDGSEPALLAELDPDRHQGGQPTAGERGAGPAAGTDGGPAVTLTTMDRLMLLLIGFGLGLLIVKQDPTSGPVLEALFYQLAVTLRVTAPDPGGAR